MDNRESRKIRSKSAVYLRRTMRKTTLTKARTCSRKKKVVRRKPKAKVFDGWHLFGAAPGMADWAIPQLKKMRDEW